MTPWILLRGLTRDSRHWGDFPRRLAEHLGHGAVFPIDLPGNGRRNAERSPARVDAMAEDCRAELARRGIATPVHVLAMSLGAMVAVAWAQRWPAEIAGAVLVNTSLRPFSPVWQRLQPRAVGPLLRLALKPASDAAWEATVLRLTSRIAGRAGDAAARCAVLDQWLTLRREHPVSRANALRQLWAAARYRAQAQAPLPPLLLLASAQDGLVDPRCTSALAAAWGCPLALHADAGHDLPLDDGGWTAAQVQRWLAGLPPASTV